MTANGFLDAEYAEWQINCSQRDAIMALDYSSGGHRRSWWRMVLISVFSFGIVSPLFRPICSRMKMVALVEACLGHKFPAGTKAGGNIFVSFLTPNKSRVLGGKEWPELCLRIFPEHARCPELAGTPVFIHAMVTPSGIRRLVVVERSNYSDFLVFVIDPGSLVRSPKLISVKEASMDGPTKALLRMEPDFPNSFMYVPTIDPKDPGRFTLAFCLCREHSVIEGRILDTGDVAMRLINSNDLVKRITQVRGKRFEENYLEKLGLARSGG